LPPSGTTPMPSLLFMSISKLQFMFLILQKNKRPKFKLQLWLTLILWYNSG
jgi:hypothetical protein